MPDYYAQNPETLRNVPRDSLEKIEAEMEAEIAAETASPVRRRTVTEIVPGTYGRIDVSEYASSAVTHVGVRFEPMSDSYAALNAAELRAAAATLVALADALDEMAGDSK